jgi:hypothetical protein
LIKREPLFFKYWMKRFKIKWIVALKLVDTYVSVKYEVEEPQMVGKLSDALNDKEKFLNQLIFVLWSAGIYLVLIIIVMFRSAFSNK